MLEVLIITVIYTSLQIVLSQIATPVIPLYDWSILANHFSASLMTNPVTMHELYHQRKALGDHKFCCLTGTNKPAHSVNKLFDNLNETELRSQSNFLNGTTYWVNDYLHVGHIHYDIVLMQVLQSTKVDRIIMQRAACHGILCAGIGTMESFYKGYFAAVFEAFNQPNIPVYLRWSWNQKNAEPFYFSVKTKDFYLSPNNLSESMRKHMELQPSTCFERMIRRTDTNYGSVPTVSSDAIHKFKKVAYEMVNNYYTSQLSSSTPSHELPSKLTTYFEKDPPYRILFSYRGPVASRHIENIQEFINKLNDNFISPTYIIRLLNNSNPYLDFQTQLHAVAESHVVITNHGAFEGNMIYMKNSSLLLEIFGHYGNNEIHTFHRLALMFGAYYGRVQPKSLTDHLAPSFNLTDYDMNEIVDIVKNYFSIKPFLNNQK
eukprot:gene10940-14689_t